MSRNAKRRRKAKEKPQSAEIHRQARHLWNVAQSANAGAWAEGVLFTVPPSVFMLDFDGQGGILVNRESLASAAGRALHGALCEIGGDRVSIGAWPREEDSE